MGINKKKAEHRERVAMEKRQRETTLSCHGGVMRVLCCLVLARIYGQVKKYKKGRLGYRTRPAILEKNAEDRTT
jgi:hypothetical protein